MSDPLAAVAAAALFMLLGWWRPRHPRPLLRRDFVTDLAHALVNGPGLDVPLAVVLAGLSTGLAPLGQGLLRAQPTWLQALVLLVLGDLVKWTLHVLQHRVPLLWRFHRLHHSVQQLDALTAIRSHPVEVFVNRLTFATFVLVLGVNPAVVAVYAFLDLLQGLWVHSNTHTRLGWLNRLVATQEFHHWHHADDPAAIDRNFGGFLSIWDWLFGTAYCPSDREINGYGLRELDPPPNGYLGHLLVPLARK